jgi:hypothetical protein
LVPAIPAVWLSGRPDFVIEHVWYLSVATVALQTLVSLGLMRMQFNSRLRFPAIEPSGDG